MTRPHATSAFAISLASVLVSSLALGAPPGLSLDWRAPEGCPTGPEVEEEVQRHLGPGTTRDTQPLALIGTLEAADDSWVLQLERTGQGSARRRVLRGASCQDLARTAALLIALMIDPTAALSSTPSASPPPTPPKSEPPEMPAAPPPRPLVSPGPAERPWSFGVSAGVGAQHGALPSTALGLGLTADAIRGRGRYELGFEVLPSRTARSDSAAGATFRLARGSLAACRLVLDGSFELAGCLSLTAGRMHAESFGISHPEARSSLWLGARAGVYGAWTALSPFAVTLRADGELPFVRPRFVLGGVGEVHQPALLVPRAELGLEVRF